jgi:hypothetical protein
LHALAATDDWVRYVEDPEWLPHAYDPRADTLTFAHLPRETQRRSVFIDNRYTQGAPRSSPAPLAELSADEIRRAAGPMHFIFHTAFCCSTLLTRALDIPGVSMGLKEPAMFMDFAQHWINARQTPGALAAFEIALDLLSRPLQAGETQIVKPSNVSTHIAPEMLHLRPDANALVVYSDLDTFLRSIARRGMAGRFYARQLFYGFAQTIPLEPAFTSDELMVQTDLQLAAQVWLMQMSFLESLVRRHGASRIRIINGDAFLRDPQRALARLAPHFKLQLDEQRAAEIVAAPVFQEHAKQLGTAFNADAQRAQNDNLSAALIEEVAAAKDWAQKLAGRCRAPMTLPNTLLD